MYGRIQKMMNDSEIHGEFCDGVWAECARTVTYYGNLKINKVNKKSLKELMIKRKLKGSGILKDLVKCVW
jgi:hypothetical protein